MKKRFISLALVLVIVVPLISTNAKADCAPTRDEAIQWLYAQEGKWHDLDGRYGAQCSDFASAYMNWLYSGETNPNQGYGVYNASYYPTVAGWNPSRWDVFSNTSSFSPEPGDIYVQPTGTTGHIGVFLSGSKSSATVIDQNSWETWALAEQYGGTGRAARINTTNISDSTYFIRYKNFSYDLPSAPGKPSVSVSRPNVTVSWNDVGHENGYDVYLIQAPYAWADIKYSQSVGANATSCTFSGVADGNYAAFVISRPNSNDVQSQWTWFSVSAPIPEGTYYLRSALNNDLAVSVAGASKEWNANVQLETFQGTLAQQFRIESYNGKYTLCNVNSGLALDVENRSTETGANLQQYNYWPWETNGQQWTFESAGDGYYYIHSDLGTYMDVVNGVAANSQNIQMYTGNGTAAQKFKLELVPPKITMTSNIFKTGDRVIVEFGDWNGAASFEYYLAEFPEAFAYTTNARYAEINWNSITFTDLSAGHYAIFVHAKNSISTSAQSNWLQFDVYENDYIPVMRKTHNGHIYALYDYESSWTFAQDLCEDLGGHLVTINDLAENWFVQNLILSGNKDAYWLGASNYEGTEANQEGTWNWVTGEPFSFTNWYEGEPSASGKEGTREHWAEIRKSYSSQWNDVNNTNKTNKGFILEIEPSDADITARERYNGSEYLLIDKNTTWSEAIEYCELLGGRLFYPDDDDEAAFVDSFLEKGTRNWYYVGADRYDGAWHRLYDGSVIPDSDIAWNGNLWPDHCNYLMKYKNSKKYINLPNVYFPEKDISEIGFICEIPNAYDVISIQATDRNGEFEIKTTGATSGKVFLALYDSAGRMVEVHAETCTGDPLTILTEKEYATAKAMLLDASLRPLCPAWESGKT